MNHHPSPTIGLSIALLVILALACGQSAPTAGPIAPTQPPSATPLPPEAGLAPGDHTRTLTFEGQERSYLLHIPASYNSAQPAALVLVYHGFQLDGQEMVRITGFSEQADQAGFIVAYPNGTGNKSSWNGGECCGEAAIRKTDDVGFTRALIQELAGLLNLDVKRVYATGFSNGAIMVYRLACDLADQIAAIGPVGAAPATETCQPARPVPVIHFHGDADALNPYAGGRGTGVSEFMPVEAGIDLWVGLNRCPTQPQETKTGSIVHRSYAPCQQNAAVELYKILGGEHAWPGGEAVSAQVGEPTGEIDATALMWAFFSAHPMP